jgi:hypothetical protein
MFLDVWHDSAWVSLDSDLDGATGITINKSSKRTKYANYGLTPQTSEISFKLWNKEGKYSYGSGTATDGIIDIDSKVRVRGAYVFQTLGAAVAESLALSGATESFYYKTESSVGTIILDENGSATDSYFTDLFTPYYDSETYDDSYYSPDAYFVKTFDKVYGDLYSISSAAIACNTTKGTIYYRFVDDLTIALTQNTSAYWTSCGATENGTKTISITNEEFIKQVILKLFIPITFILTHRHSLKLANPKYRILVVKDAIFINAQLKRI